MKKQTSVKRLVGLNVRGTPKMRFRKVRQDLKAIAAQDPGVVTLQEFKWPWYWLALRSVFGKGWNRRPKIYRGARSSQPVLWDKDQWTEIETRRRLIHPRSKVTQARYIRGVLLEDPETGLRAWHVTTHFVTKGSNPKSTSLRKSIFAQDVVVTRGFLTELSKTGWPVIVEGDFNVHYKPWETINGNRVFYVSSSAGPDLLFYICGSKAHVVEQYGAYRTVPADRLNTDHPMQIFSYVLVER